MIGFFESKKSYSNINNTILGSQFCLSIESHYNVALLIGDEKNNFMQICSM